jgi:hypothetical protein
MADERKRIPIDPDYINALGLATFVFADLSSGRQCSGYDVEFKAAVYLTGI